ncbi:MAG: SapB/AmfS family lanthipeptide [Pseudonocardiaceae bacterium]|jgi:hypothetical protein|nr:SapB/AmfS family lanthipeptide [Pseudonocardiaceae bacterium]
MVLLDLQALEVLNGCGDDHEHGHGHGHDHGSDISLLLCG